MPLKRCARCKEEKPYGAFTKHRRKPDGLYNYCKLCVAVISRADYAVRRDSILASVKRYRESPVGAAKKRAWDKKHYAENRDEQLVAAKQWARDNKPRRRAYVRQWNDDNRDRVRSYQKNYKAKKRSTGRAAVPASAWNLIKATFRNRCVYCGKETKLEQDHVTPLSRGGEHLPHNIVPSCRHCNATKLNNEPETFWWLASA